MTDKIKLDIISDVVCPWCIIGYKRVVKAISEMKIQDRVDIEWHPFELNPDMPAEGEEIHAHIARKYGTTLNESRQTLANMTILGAEMGFTFDFFDGMKMVNTFNLHILLDYAKESGKQTEFKMSLFDAFFNERKNVFDRKILAQELQNIGLNESEGLMRLDDDIVRNQVLVQQSHWKNSGISAVPTMIFNNSISLIGAQPVDVYKQELTSYLQGNISGPLASALPISPRLTRK